MTQLFFGFQQLACMGYPGFAFLRVLGRDMCWVLVGASPPEQCIKQQLMSMCVIGTPCFKIDDLYAFLSMLHAVKYTAKGQGGVNKWDLCHGALAFQELGQPEVR